MAKIQRSNKQPRKPKAVEKKPSGPKYLRSSDTLQTATLGEHRAKPKATGN